jgi:hypothetical protein
VRGAARGRQLGPVLLAALGLGVPLVWAEGDVLARVGSLVVDGARFRARLATLPGELWGELGATWPERRRRVLDLLIDEALLATAAEREPALPSGRDLALARALRLELATEVPAPSAAELEAWAARSPDEPSAPRALELFRILVHTDDEARALIRELGAVDRRSRFGQLARERSIDESTKERSGYLGWVAADGQTDVPELRVAPELFLAAESAADGALLGEPVRELDAFAVVWRRASRPARASDTVEVARERGARWADEQRAGAERRLLETLRSERLREHHPERLSGFEPSFVELPRRAPAAPDAVIRWPWLQPVPTDRGLR